MESISTVSSKLKSGQLSSVALTQYCLERISTLNPVLNAFITVMTTEALRAAQKADEEIGRGEWKGPLHGIPVAVKDFYDTAGTRTTAAFQHFKDRVPAKDAEVVERLKAAGAVLLGKTNMDQLGMGTTSLTGYFGSVRNPWNTHFVAGGSSGGSAAAVAAGLCYATVDTDAIGSCRLPAACCGVTGFKVSPGLISQKGILEGEPVEDVILQLSQTGITTRSVADTAIMLNALATTGPVDYRFALESGSAATLGIVTNYNATDPIREVFDAAVNIFRAGYACTEVEVPLGPASFHTQHIVSDRQAIHETLFRKVDLLLLPTLTTPVLSVGAAIKGGPQAVSPENTLFCNYYGLPAVSVPCGRDARGMPIGLQIAGPAGGEARVLEVAHAFQQATIWHWQEPRL